VSNRFSFTAFRRFGTFANTVRHPKRHPLTKRIHKLFDESSVLFDRKNQDYAKETDPFHNVRSANSWGVDPWVGVMIRLEDKVHRLHTFAKKKKLNNESAQDSLRDISVYALIALALYEEQSRGENEQTYARHTRRRGR